MIRRYNSNQDASVGLGLRTMLRLTLEFLLQGAGVPNAGLVQRDRQQNFYHFWRWTWVQYVWLALAHGAAVSWAVGNIYRGVPEDESSGRKVSRSHSLRSSRWTRRSANWLSGPPKGRPRHSMEVPTNGAGRSSARTPSTARMWRT